MKLHIITQSVVIYFHLYKYYIIIRLNSQHLISLEIVIRGKRNHIFLLLSALANCIVYNYILNYEPVIVLGHTILVSHISNTYPQIRLTPGKTVPDEGKVKISWY